MSFAHGTRVLVQWSDGNRYEATIADLKDDHVMVSFHDGQQHWIHQGWCSAMDAPPIAAPPQAARPRSVHPDAHGGGGMQQGAMGGGMGAGPDSYQGPLPEHVQEEWNDLQALIARVESQQVPLRNVDPQRPETLWKVIFAIEEAQQNGLALHMAVQQHGFSDPDHYDLVRSYVTAKWSHITQDEDGTPEVRTRPEFDNAAMQSRMGQVVQMQSAAAAADPNLLAPVNGVSVEQWARAAVALGSLGQGATEADSARVLAEMGLDMATYQAAQAGWQAKMQGDTTGAIAQKYGEAFAAGQGASWQVGSVGAAAGGPGGAEPCTFEYFTEIQVAQTCWSEAGKDVNAELARVFGIDAMEYSRLSSYWSAKMMSDVSLFQRQSELEAQFRAKHASRGLDDDLSL